MPEETNNNNPPPGGNNGGPGGGVFDGGEGQGVGGGNIRQQAHDVGGPGESGRFREEIVLLQSQLAQACAELEAARAELALGARRREIEALLIEAETIDLEAGTTLALAALRQDPQADAGAIVARLRQTKPYLFRAPAAGGLRRAAVMAPASVEPSRGGGGGLEDLYQQAQGTGDRADLLRYMRAKRAM